MMMGDYWQPALSAARPWRRSSQSFVVRPEGTPQSIAVLCGLETGRYVDAEKAEILFCAVLTPFA